MYNWRAERELREAAAERGLPQAWPDRDLSAARSFARLGSSPSAFRLSRLGLALACLTGLLLTRLLLTGGADIGEARRALAQPDCRSVAIRSPFSGDVLSGTVAILGSARIDAFQFYKLEWAPEAEPESWRAVSSTIDRPVSNGRLDLWDTQALPDGRYRLKLTAVDQQSGERCRALVAPLWLANSATPEATEAATPLPSITAIPRQRPAGPAAGAGIAAEAESTGTAESETTPLLEDSGATEGLGAAEDPAAAPEEESQDDSHADANARSEGEPNASSEKAASPGPMVAGGEAMAEAGGSFLMSASIGFATVMLALLGLALVWLAVGRRRP